MPMPATPPEVVDRICELYEEGYTHAAIAEEVGVGKTTVGRYLRERGLIEGRRPGPTPGATTDLDDKQLRRALRMRSEGYGYATIAQKVGTTAEVVRAVTSTPEARDEMYGLSGGRWVLCPVTRVQAWVAA